MTKYWIAVASKNHVANGVKGGFAQVCHGKAAPLRRLKIGDGIIYYSPKLEFGADAACQEFTAIGKVVGEEVYQYDMGGGFVPYRRDIKYHSANSVSIKPLIPKLNFITDKQKWGYKFRFGLFEVPAEDFKLIEDNMLAKPGL